MVVEILPQITNIYDHVSNLQKTTVLMATENLVANDNKGTFREFVHAAGEFSTRPPKRPSPVSDQLGHHRIMRVSPLTEVPEIC